MGKIYFSSDLHFGHDREFIYKPRGFSSIDEHDTAIIARWNTTVEPDDDAYLLGDSILGDTKIGLGKLLSLNGKIHLIIGNHDTSNRIEEYKKLPNIVSVDYATMIKYGKYHFFLSHYPCLCANHDDDRPLKARCISVCGHSHYKNPFRDMDKGLIYHCELDCNSIQPILIDKIIENLKWFSTLSIERKKQIISMEVYNEKDRYNRLEDE